MDCFVAEFIIGPAEGRTRNDVTDLGAALLQNESSYPAKGVSSTLRPLDSIIDVSE